MTDGAGAFAEAVAKGPLYVALATFVSGFLVSLTPCVYPMVAITVSVFGAKESKSRSHSVLLSAAFVIGIVCMFVPLGVFAAMTGKAFGSVLSNTWVVIGISALFLVMAAAMFGAFELDIPGSLKNKLATIGGGGYLGAFSLGLICGPIAAPCTGPFLTGILAWIAQAQNPSMGGLVMAAFALGLGVPFFLVGAFAMQLPKSGRWMVHIKSVLGLILCVVALYFLANVFPELRFAPGVNLSWWIYGLGVGALAIGVLLGAVHRSFQGFLEEKVAKGVGVLLVVGGAFLLLQAKLQPNASLSWHGHADNAVGSVNALEQAKLQAKAEGRPMLVDFTAAWCAACKELDKVTFADDAVKQEAGRFVAAKVDASDDETPGLDQVMAEYKVVGLPTVLLLDSQGREVRRFTDFVDAPRFVDALREAQ